MTTGPVQILVVGFAILPLAGRRSSIVWTALTPVWRNRPCQIAKSDARAPVWLAAARWPWHLD